MTGKERVFAALHRKKPDRVPTLEWSFYPQVMMDIAGTESDIEFVQKMEIDGIAVNLDRRVTKVDEKSFLDDFGVLRAFHDEYPSTLDHPIKSPKDLKRFKMADPDDDAIYQSMLKAQKEVGAEKAVVGRVRDVFSFPRDMLGYENFMMDLYLEPELVSDLMEISVEYSAAVAKNLKRMGIGIVAVLDDIANQNGPLIAPNMYRAQVLPHFTKLIAAFHALELLVIKHTDGDLSTILDDLVNSGIDCLDPIDPMGHMDMMKIQEQHGSRIAVKGNIDCVYTLVEGTLDEVEKEVLACIAAGAKGGGHIISSSNSIHKSINPKNYAHMLACIKKYGKYPLDTGLFGQ